MPTNTEHLEAASICFSCWNSNKLLKVNAHRLIDASCRVNFHKDNNYVEAQFEKLHIWLTQTIACECARERVKTLQSYRSVDRPKTSNQTVDFGLVQRWKEITPRHKLVEYLAILDWWAEHCCLKEFQNSSCVNITLPASGWVRAPSVKVPGRRPVIRWQQWSYFKHQTDAFAPVCEV